MHEDNVSGFLNNIYHEYVAIWFMLVARVFFASCSVHFMVVQKKEATLLFVVTIRISENRESDEPWSQPWPLGSGRPIH